MEHETTLRPEEQRIVKGKGKSDSEELEIANKGVLELSKV